MANGEPSAASVPARFDVSKIRVASVWYHPELTIESEFDPGDENLYISSSTLSRYDPATTRLDSLIEVNSQGGYRATHFTYGVPGRPSQLTSVAVNNADSVMQKRWAVWDETPDTGGRHDLREIRDWHTGDPAGSAPGGANSTLVQKIFYYDRWGNPLGMHNARGDTTLFFYGSNTHAFTQGTLNGAAGVYLTGIRQVNPAGADLSSSAAYDTLGRLVRLTGPDGHPAWFEYDKLHRLAARRGPLGELVESYDMYHSGLFNGGLFSAGDPSFTRLATYPGIVLPVQNPRFEADWSEAAGQELPGGWTRSGLSTRRGAGYGSGSALEVQSNSLSNFVQARIAEPHFLDFSIGYYYVDQQVHFKVFVPYGGMSQSASMKINLLRIDPDDGSVKASSQDFNYTVPTMQFDTWADVTGTIRIYSGSAWTNPDYRTVLRISITTSDKWVRIDDLVLQQLQGAESARYLTQYADGLGRVLQTHQRDGTADIVTAAQYDNRGRPWRNWKPWPAAASGHVYKADFATQANQYYSPSGAGPDASGRAYIEQLYSTEPAARPLRVHPEGVSHAGQTLRYSYGVQTVDGLTLAFTETTDESEKRTRTWSDAWGRTLRSTAAWGHADSATTRFSYDALNQLLQVRTHLNRITTYQYDRTGRLAGKTTPDAATPFLYAYDPAGNLRYMRNANLAAAGRYLAYSYDFAGRLITEQTCTGTIPADPAAACTTPQQAISYTWDDAGAGSDVSFAINNAAGRMTRVDFNSGEYYLYSYNNRGLVERMFNKLNGLAGRTITYTWNRAGQLTSVHLSGDTHRWWYTYNAPGQLQQVRTNTSTTPVTDAAYTWWPAGMVRNETLGNRTNAHGYDARDRLLTINNTGSSTHRFSACYTWESNNTVKFAEFRQPWSPHDNKRYRYAYEYDSRNQLKSAIYTILQGSAWIPTSNFDVTGLEYDSDGNIMAFTRRTNTGAAQAYSYQYNGGTNRLTTAFKNGTPTHFGYDPSGNVTTIGTGYDITNTVYDRRNLPTAISKGSATYNYRYDHAGLRVYKQEGFNIHTLRGAFGEPLATYSNGSLAYWNILRPDGTVIGRRQGSNRLYYHRDLLGSTRTVVNASGDVEQTWDYYPFGLEMPGRSIPTGTTARERFTGHERDEEVGLDYMKARRYAAEFGRFLSVDPMASSFPEWSPYNYGLNNPIVNIDSDGEFVISFISGFIRGLREDDATFRSAVSEGWQSVKNTAQIWSSLGRGDFGQIASKFTWELPQQLAGVTTGVVNNWFGNVRSVSHSEGATLVETQSSGWGGFTLGSVIHAQRGTEASASDNLFVHEYGHYLQSRRVGPLYLPVVGAPSLVSAVVNDYQGHKQFWTERWADRLSERHFSQTHTQPSLPKTPEHRRQEELRRMMLHMRR
jgi:RHS repeat-associated protein